MLQAKEPTEGKRPPSTAARIGERIEAACIVERQQTCLVAEVWRVRAVVSVKSEFAEADYVSQETDTAIETYWGREKCSAWSEKVGQNPDHAERFSDHDVRISDGL